MFKRFENELGNGRIMEIKHSINKGYVFDMAISRHTTKSYMTMTSNSLVLNISNEKLFQI